MMTERRGMNGDKGIVLDMKCLFLDIASHDGLLALVTEQEVIAYRAVHNRVPDHELIPLMEELLRQGGWSYSHLTHIACVVGPGGFMSLRVASACANTLVSQLNILSVGIHLSDVYRARIGAHTREGYWLHSTKKDQLFIDGGQWNEPTLINLQELQTLIPRFLWIGELLPEHEKALEAHGLKKAALREMTEILPRFLAEQRYSRQNIIPWYGRG